MKTRHVASVIVLLVALGLVSAPAAAQLGPWSEQHPAWVDLNRNGIVDPGETTLYPVAVWNDQLPTSDPDYLYVVLAGNPWDGCAGHLESRYNVTPLLSPTSITRRRGDFTQTVAGATPAFTFNETKYVPDVPTIVGLTPRRVRVLEEVPTANGGGGLLDEAPADGLYEGLRVTGSKGGTSVGTTDLDFVYRDVNGNGTADYVSLPWALTGVLGVKTSNDCVGGAGGAPQIWLPLTDGNGDGLPDRVSVRFPDPRTPGAVGGLDGPPMSAAVFSAFAVPSASTVGLAAFAAALVLAGLKLLRGSLAVS